MNLETNKCNLCDNTRVQELFTQTDILTMNEANFSLVKCGQCGLVYVANPPSIEEIEKFYPEDFVSFHFNQ